MRCFLRLIIDLDGTICSEEKQFSRPLAKPKAGVSKAMQTLFEAGHTLIIYSARTWAEYEMTVDWLQKNHIPYHQLILGKPIGEYWIDDRSIKFTSWQNILDELL